jgi:hypothetical protein
MHNSNLFYFILSIAKQHGEPTVDVAVSEFEPWAVFQGCTCTGFSLDYLAVISQNPQNSFIESNAESTGHALLNG